MHMRLRIFYLPLNVFVRSVFLIAGGDFEALTNLRNNHNDHPKQPPKATTVLLYSFAFVSPNAAISLKSFLWILPDYPHISTYHPQIAVLSSKLTGFFGTASMKCTPPSNRLCLDTRSASHALIASASCGPALSVV